MKDLMIVEQQGQVALMNLGLPGLTLLKLDLFTNNFVPSGNNDPFASFTLPTYTGYANVVPAFSAAYIDQPSQEAASITGQASFGGASSGPGASVYGWVLYDGTAHTVWAAGNFSGGPIGLNTALDKLTLSLQLVGINTGFAWWTV